MHTRETPTSRTAQSSPIAWRVVRSHGNIRRLPVSRKRLFMELHSARVRDTLAPAFCHYSINFLSFIKFKRGAPIPQSNHRRSLSSYFYFFDRKILTGKACCGRIGTVSETARINGNFKQVKEMRPNGKIDTFKL